MLLLWTIEFVAIGLFILGLVTQVLIPLASDKPLFPILRPKEKIARDLREAEEGVEEAKLRRRVEKTRRAARRFDDTEPPAVN